jgi:N-methylhydantoinase A
MGCLLVDVQHDLSTSYLKPAAAADSSEIEAAFAALEKEAAERLAHENVPPDAIVMQRTLDMMYQGQWRSLAVSAPAPMVSMEEMIDAFHREHEREYNFRRDDAPVGVFRLNLKAVGVVPKAEVARAESTGGEVKPHTHRAVWFAGLGGAKTPIYWRSDLPAGCALKGPAIIEQLDSTTVVPPGFTAAVDPWLNIILRLEA